MLNISKTIIFAFGCILCSFGFDYLNTEPVQPSSGPGGKDYRFEEVLMEDFAQKKDGYWLFSPKDFKEEAKQVVVFLHGYGAYNPMIYGGWIEHIVKKGNLVIFPRYQKNVISPGPKKFTSLAAIGIRAGIEQLKSRGVLSETHDLYIAAHSYGGVIASGLANNPQDFNLPSPKAMLLCSPGTGPFKGGVLDSYEGIDPNMKIVTMVALHDHVVGDKFAFHLYENSKQVKQFDLIRQLPDSFGDLFLSAHHNECYAMLRDFDTGVRNVTAKRALRVASTDAIDFNGYWKIFDALMDCSANNEYCDLATGGGEKQLSLGAWKDEIMIRPLVLLSER